LSLVTAGTSCDAVSPVHEADGIQPYDVLHEAGVYVVAGSGGLVSSKDGVHFQSTLRKNVVRP
jgi:hypothetical protein